MSSHHGQFAKLGVNIEHCIGIRNDNLADAVRCLLHKDPGLTGEVDADLKGAFNSGWSAGIPYYSGADYSIGAIVGKHAVRGVRWAQCLTRYPGKSGGKIEKGFYFYLPRGPLNDRGWLDVSVMGINTNRASNRYYGHGNCNILIRFYGVAGLLKTYEFKNALMMGDGRTTFEYSVWESSGTPSIADLKTSKEDRTPTWTANDSRRIGVAIPWDAVSAVCSFTFNVGDVDYHDVGDRSPGYDYQPSMRWGGHVQTDSNEQDINKSLEYNYSTRGLFNP